MARQHAVIDARCGDLYEPRPGDEASDRAVPIPHDLAVASVIHEILVSFEKQVDLNIQRSLKQRLGSTTHDFIQW